MFEVLVESAARPPAGLGSRVASILVHGGLVALIIASMGRSSSTQAPRPVAVPIDIYVPPAPTAAPGVGGTGPSPGTVLRLPPAVPGDVLPVVPPLSTPIISTSLGPSARDLAIRDLGDGGRSPGGSEPAVLLAGEVDQPVRVLVSARLVYPPELAAAGIAGEVRLEFVVDSGGRCEAASVRVISSTNPAFEASARNAVCEATYRAGRVRGQPVRQLVRQTVAFRQR